VSDLIEIVARAQCGADHPNFADGGHPGVDDLDREQARVSILAVAEYLDRIGKSTAAAELRAAVEP
jgi:hypothetical protein